MSAERRLAELLNTGIANTATLIQELRTEVGHSLFPSSWDHFKINVSLATREALLRALELGARHVKWLGRTDGTKDLPEQAAGSGGEKPCCRAGCGSSYSCPSLTSATFSRQCYCDSLPQLDKASSLFSPGLNLFCRTSGGYPTALIRGFLGNGRVFLGVSTKTDRGEWRICEFWQTHEPHGIHFSRNPCQKDVTHTASIFTDASLRETFNKLFTWEGNKKENGTNESHENKTAPVGMLGRTRNRVEGDGSGSGTRE